MFSCLGILYRLVTCFDKPTPTPSTLPWAAVSREMHTALEFWEQTECQHWTGHLDQSTLFLTSRLRDITNEEVEERVRGWGGVLWNAVRGMAVTHSCSHTKCCPRHGCYTHVLTWNAVHSMAVSLVFLHEMLSTAWLLHSCSHRHHGYLPKSSTRSSQPKFYLDGVDRPHCFLRLYRQLDSCWWRETYSFVRMWPLVGFPCASGCLHIYVRVDLVGYPPKKS